jgi:hypothetical protein
MVATQAAASTVAYATLTIATAPSDGENIVFALYGGAETVTVTGEDPAIEDWTVDVASQRAAVGGAITIKATAYDQFGIEIANSPVAVSVSGRNTVAAKNYVSDADGRISLLSVHSIQQQSHSVHTQLEQSLLQVELQLTLLHSQL